MNGEPIPVLLAHCARSRVTIGGAPASATFAAWVEESHAKMTAHNACPPCTSVLYVERPHPERCPSRGVAEALFGLLGGAS